MPTRCPSPSRGHLQPPSYGPVLSPVNKPHGGVSKLPSVNQLVGQPPPHSSAAGPSLGPMGELLGSGAPRWVGEAQGEARFRTGRFRPAQGPHGGPRPAAPATTGGTATGTPHPVLLRGRGWGEAVSRLRQAPRLPPGPGILNTHGHTLPANGEMNGSHSSQPMVSGSHCTPPPSYHADPSLVRYVGCCWALPLTHCPSPFAAPARCPRVCPSPCRE